MIRLEHSHIDASQIRSNLVAVLDRIEKSGISLYNYPDLAHALTDIRTCADKHRSAIIYADADFISIAKSCVEVMINLTQNAGYEHCEFHCLYKPDHLSLADPSLNNCTFPCLGKDVPYLVRYSQTCSDLSGLDSFDLVGVTIIRQSSILNRADNYH